MIESNRLDRPIPKKTKRFTIRFIPSSDDWLTDSFIVFNVNRVGVDRTNDLLNTGLVHQSLDDTPRQSPEVGSTANF
jgi:hypothetical protein